MIEDNPDVADSMLILLGVMGHEAQVAGDGASGLAAARRFMPHVVLCDVGLPGDMDGYDVGRALRDDPVLARSRRIALTGYGHPEDERRAHEAGFERHMVKPIDPDLMESILTG